MVDVVIKSSGQREAEAEVKNFADDLGPFVVAAEETRMAMVFTSADTPEKPIIFANDSFLALSGYDREEVLGQSFNFLLYRSADQDAIDAIQAGFDGHSTLAIEVKYRRKDGNEFWAEVFISPVRDEDGKVVQYFASFMDSTRHKQQQAQSRMLIDELNHRVKNTLATVQSIVWQALRSGSDPDAVRQAIESRLFALSRSHDLLTLQNWEGADLRDLMHQALAPFAVAGEPEDRIEMSGPEVQLSSKAALALSIAFNELATNAAKYGALSIMTGRLSVDWNIVHPNGVRSLNIVWQERGGPLVVLPARKGFGSKVLQRGLALELHATVQLDFLPTGLRYDATFPLPGDLDA